VDVDVDHAPPVIDCQVSPGGEQHQPGVVDQDINPAVLLLGKNRDFVERLRLGDIGHRPD